MLKNVILHPIGDQPMLADLYARPQPSDISLLCTNVRTIDGKRPTSIDHPDGLLVIPLATIRFIEVPSAELAATDAAQPAQPAQPVLATPPLERNGHNIVPLELPASGEELTPAEVTHEEDLEANEELLRRIREL